MGPFETWINGLHETTNPAHAARFRELCRHARAAGVLAYKKRRMPGEDTPMRVFYDRLEEFGYRRCEIRGPKRIVVSRGYADDRVYIASVPPVNPC